MVQCQRGLRLQRKIIMQNRYQLSSFKVVLKLCMIYIVLVIISD